MCTLLEQQGWRWQNDSFILSAQRIQENQSVMRSRVYGLAFIVKRLVFLQQQGRAKSQKCLQRVRGNGRKTFFIVFVDIRLHQDPSVISRQNNETLDVFLLLSLCHYQSLEKHGVSQQFCGFFRFQRFVKDLLKLSRIFQRLHKLLFNLCALDTSR